MAATLFSLNVFFEFTVFAYFYFLGSRIMLTGPLACIEDRTNFVVQSSQFIANSLKVYDIIYIFRCF